MNDETKVAKINGKFAIIAAIIGGVCLIISAIIGVFSYDLNKSNKTLTQENTELSEENSDWESSYNDLQERFATLEEENISLSKEINDLKKSINQYTSLMNEYEPLNAELSEYLSLKENYDVLLSENNSLKSNIEQLQNELQQLKSDNYAQENAIINKTDSLNTSGKKISIFDLPISKGDKEWHVPSSDDLSTGTDGNLYTGSRWVVHCATTKDNTKYTFTYSLDKKYSTCVGEIVWSRYSSNVEGSAWVEFYSGNELIYKTDPITADSAPVTFSFNVQEIEKLTIVRNSTTSSDVAFYAAYIIYPYLDLVE